VIVEWLLLVISKLCGSLLSLLVLVGGSGLGYVGFLRKAGIGGFES